MDLLAGEMVDNRERLVAEIAVAEIGEDELAEGSLFEAHLVLTESQGAVLAVAHIERDGAPSRRRQLVDLGQEFWRAAAPGPKR